MSSTASSNTPLTKNSDFLALLDQAGISPDYLNIWNEKIPVPERTLAGILDTFGLAVDSHTNLTQLCQALKEKQAKTLPKVVVHKVTQQPLKLDLSKLNISSSSAQSLQWQIIAEESQKEIARGAINHLEKLAEWQLPTQLTEGYFNLLISDTSNTTPAQSQTIRLIITPEQCYLPPSYSETANVSQNSHTPKSIKGVAIQLYAFRSKRNWGLGDFTDLLNLIDWCAKADIGVIGLNPLHELFPDEPRHFSPYSPSSRLYLNTLYLDVEAIADYQESDTLKMIVGDPAFQKQIDILRASEYVDYQGVAALKRPILEECFEEFDTNHLSQNTDYAKDFQQFCKQEGKALLNLALFQTLHEHFIEEDRSLWNWQAWPADYQNPDSEAVKTFAKTHEKRVQYYQYLQWQAHLQLTQVQEASRKLEIGLYLDIAVGSDLSSAEVWENPTLFSLNMKVGAPPDECNQKGQDWGLPPMRPDELKNQSYEPFIQILRQNMRYGGALRMDHIMGLRRLFWIPNWTDATEGAYVFYPFDDLLGILALESQRQQCLVIGENLGTVPPEVQTQMDEWGILSYKVFFFEKSFTDNQCTYQPSSSYPRLALVSVSTHDLPTLSGYWQGQDLETRTELDLFPSEDFEKREYESRVTERLAILEQLKAEGCIEASLTPESPQFEQHLSIGVHRFLQKTPSYIQMNQPEDWFAQPKQINLPGTVEQYPNWQRKLTVPLEDWPTQPVIQSVLLTP